MRDNIFNKKSDLIDFTFNVEVAKVFDDMVRRSIPGYTMVLELIALISKNYQHDGICYDLGCSTGATAIAINFSGKSNTIIAIDNSLAMIKKCSKNITNFKNIKLICADIENIDIKNADFVVLNFTLQFITKDKRQQLINKIYEGLNKGGALIISEKVEFDNNKQHIINDLHIEFKRANGYSELEIAKKRELLKNTLIADNKETHLNRLKSAKFDAYFCYLQCLNFMSFLAIK